LECFHWAENYQSFNKKKLGNGVYRNLTLDYKRLFDKDDEEEFTKDQLSLNRGVCHFYLY